jgi:hypothetical protein
VEERRMLEGQKRKAQERNAALERSIKTLETRLQTCVSLKYCMRNGMQWSDNGVFVGSSSVSAPS